MISYINSKGNVLAVFRSVSGRYRVYIRYEPGEDFKGFSSLSDNYFATRSDAEAAMRIFTIRSRDKSWKLCEKWSG